MNYLTILELLITVAHVGAYTDNEEPFLHFSRDNSLVIPVKHYSMQVFLSGQYKASNARIRRRGVRHDWPLLLPRSGRTPPQKQGSGSPKTQVSSRTVRQQGESSKPVLPGEGSSPTNSGGSPGKSKSGHSVSDLVSVFEGKSGTASSQQPGTRRSNSPKSSQQLNKDPLLNQGNVRGKLENLTLKEPDKGGKSKKNAPSSKQESSKLGSPERKMRTSGDSSTASDKSNQTPQKTTHQTPRFDSPNRKMKSAGQALAGSDKADKLKEPDIFSTQQLSPFNSPNPRIKSSIGSDMAEKLKQPDVFSTQQLSPINSPDKKLKPGIGSDVAEKLKQEHLFSTMQELPSFQSPDRKMRPGTGSGESDKSARLQSLQETPPRAYTPWQSPAGKKQPENPGKSDKSARPQSLPDTPPRAYTPWQSPDGNVKPSTSIAESDKSARPQSIQDTPPRSYTPWQSPEGKKLPDKPGKSDPSRKLF